jgi:hypothetical protein
MATYNLKYNKDDSVIRHILIGLLADLNKKLSFYRQITNDKRVIVDVPFYYSISGDENFMRDNFLFSTLNGENCDPDPAKANGNYDRIPRGIVTLTSLAVDPSKLVNKRNQGHYTRINEEGNLQGFVSEFQMIPIVVGIDIEILLESQLDMFKVTESLITKMYRANTFQVDAGHIEDGTYRIASEYAMPDDYGQERPIEFSFDDKGAHKVTFSIEVNSFIPAFDFEEDIYKKVTISTYANGNIYGTYADPNASGNITYAVEGTKYFSSNNSVWECNNNGLWILISENHEIQPGDLVEPAVQDEFIERISRRRPESNRMFTLGSSDIVRETSENQKPLLGDNYKVTGRDLPFNE